MLFVIESFLKVEQKVRVRVIVGLDKSEELYLVQRLVEKVFVIGNHFKTTYLAFLQQISDFNNFSEHSTT
jgi:hypothetical protein